MSQPTLKLSEEDVFDRDELHALLAGQLYRHRIPGASLCLRQGSRIVSAAAGFANLAEGVVADDGTIFQIGSITKVMTASLAMMLVEEGKLSLDAPVREVLPDLKIAGGPLSESVTLRMLLSHTSGLDGDFPFESPSGADAVATQTRAYRNLPRLSPPGLYYSYSNPGYVIAGRMIEVVENRPFNNILADRVLKPIGARRFAFTGDQVLRFRAAVGHHWNEAASRFDTADPVLMNEGESPAGSILAMSARDLMCFAELHLADGEAPNDVRVLAAGSVGAMQTPHGRVPLQGDLHLAWAGLELGGERAYAHYGGTICQSSCLIIVPGCDLALTLLTNTYAGAELVMSDLGRALLYAASGLEAPDGAAAGDTGAGVAAENVTEPALTIEGRYAAGSGVLTVTAADAATRFRFEPSSWLTRMVRIEPYEGRLEPAGRNRWTTVADGASPSPQRPIGFLDDGTGNGRATHLWANGRVMRREDP